MVMKGREIILGILKGGPHTGYEINDILQTRLNHFFDATFGMIYPTLKKLETEGLVTKRQVAQSDKPNKNVYQITPAGEETFLKALHEPTADEVFKSDFLMRLYFSQDLPDDEVCQFLDEEIARKTQKLSELQAQLDFWVSQGMTKTQRMTFDYGEAYYTATLATLQAARSNF